MEWGKIEERYGDETCSHACDSYTPTTYSYKETHNVKIFFQKFIQNLFAFKLNLKSRFLQAVSSLLYYVQNL